MRETLTQTDYLADEAKLMKKSGDEPVAASARAPAHDAQAMTVAEPAAEPLSNGLGWIYLGKLEGTTWKTRYTSWEQPTLPPVNTKLQLRVASNVRSARPDQYGRLAPVRISLPIRAQLEILEVTRWQDSEIWARVKRPPAALN